MFGKLSNNSISNQVYHNRATYVKECYMLLETRKTWQI